MSTSVGGKSVLLELLCWKHICSHGGSRDSASKSKLEVFTWKLSCWTTKNHDYVNRGTYFRHYTLSWRLPHSIGTLLNFKWQQTSILGAEQDLSFSYVLRVPVPILVSREFIRAVHGSQRAVQLPKFVCLLQSSDSQLFSLHWYYLPVLRFSLACNCSFTRIQSSPNSMPHCKSCGFLKLSDPSQQQGPVSGNRNPPENPNNYTGTLDKEIASKHQHCKQINHSEDES